MTYNAPNDKPNRTESEPTLVDLSPDADACRVLGCRRSEPLSFADETVVCAEHLETDTSEVAE
jgi:hypothetical protein